MNLTDRQMEAARRIANLPQDHPEIYEDLDFFRKDMVEFAQNLLKECE